MKYVRTFLLALQTEMQYRANLVMWLVVGMITPLTMVMVWFKILGERAELGGYTQTDFVMYYVFFTLGWYVVGGAFARQIGREIHNGNINKTLLKPYNIVFAEAVSEQAWKLTSLLVTLPAIGILLYLMRDFVAWQMVPGQGWYLVPTLILAALIFGLIQAIVGILAFWVTEIWPFSEMVDVVLYLFGGMLAPISLLPEVIQKITTFLPFRYIFYEPVTLMLGHQSDPLGVLWKQALFIIILYVIYRIMWRAGIRRYEGIGG